MGPHSDADDRDFADLVVVEDLLETDLVFVRLECLDALATVGHGQGEGDVGLHVREPGDVLHDHVDVDARIRDDFEDRGGRPHLVGDTDDGDLGLAAVVGHARDDGFFHFACLPDLVVGFHPGARFVTEGRTDVDLHVFATRVLDAAQVEDLGAGGGQLHHLLVADLGDPAGARHDPRVGAVDAVDVGVDLAVVGAQGRGQRDRRGVGGAATQRRDVLGGLRHALETGDDDDAALLQGTHDAARGDVDDARVAVGGGGEDACLGTGVADGLDPEVGQGHRQQRSRLAFSRGQQHVQLAGLRLRRDLQREVHQLVGGVTHRRDDDDDVVPFRARPGDPPGHALDGLGIRDRRATVFLNNASHAKPPCREGRLPELPRENPGGSPGVCSFQGRAPPTGTLADGCQLDSLVPLRSNQPSSQVCVAAAVVLPTGRPTAAYFSYARAR